MLQILFTIVFLNVSNQKMTNKLAVSINNIDHFVNGIVTEKT